MAQFKIGDAVTVSGKLFFNEVPRQAVVCALGKGRDRPGMIYVNYVNGMTWSGVNQSWLTAA